VGTERQLRARSDEQVEENRRLLISLQQRQRQLEELLAIQQSVSEHAPLQAIIDAVVASAAELLGAQAVTLRLPGGAPSREGLLAPVHGTASEDPPSIPGPVSAGVLAGAGLAAAADEAEADAEFPGLGARSALGAAVPREGGPCGSLVAVWRAADRSGSKADHDMLLAFAALATLALDDARRGAQLVRQAFYDELTGLPNRALFMDRLAQALEETVRTGHGVAVLLCDVDRFKVVNDSLGHTAGDALLVAVADRLRSCVRTPDTASRLGGDEFAVIVRDVVDHGHAVGVADRVLATVGTPFRVAGHELHVSISVGIAVGTGTAATAGDLLRDADLAMYRSKATRGGVEALARWRRAGVPVPPLDFIVVAEETGLIIPLGRHILDRACRQAVEWRAGHPAHRELMLSVNLAPRQLQDEHVVNTVTGVLVQTGLPPTALVLEITENALIEDPHAAQRLEELRGHGIRVAIDDFGTGYSSLGYLRRFPVDVLKIDRSFVAGVGAGDEPEALVRAILALGDALHLRVVAEGVESAAQADRLRALGCTLAQGFTFAHPLPAAALGRLLGDQRGP